MAASDINTFKRDSISRMVLGDAQTVLAQLPAAIKHFNERHRHSIPKVTAPGEFGQQLVEQLRRDQPEQRARHFE